MNIFPRLPTTSTTATSGSSSGHAAAKESAAHNSPEVEENTTAGSPMVTVALSNTRRAVPREEKDFFALASRLQNEFREMPERALLAQARHLDEQRASLLLA